MTAAEDQTVYLAATATHLPPAVRSADAVAEGLLDRRSARRCDLESVCVSSDESAPEMAASAARAALRRLGATAGSFELLLHANMYHQGREMWPAASYVQRRSIANRCPAVDVRQMSNGGMAAMHLARSYLAGRRDPALVLVTTGDRFAPPTFDRWNTDPGTIYGDGGTAAVLSNRTGFARFRSLAMVCDSELEQMHRGTGPFEDAASLGPRPMSLERRKDEFVAERGVQFALDRVERGQDEVVDRALDEAGVKLADVDWFVLPAFGRRRLDLGLLRRLDISPEQCTWEWSRRIGHLGAGDQIAGLDHLMTSGRAVSGQLCLLVGIGAGFSWSGAVLEIL